VGVPFLWRGRRRIRDEKGQPCMGYAGGKKGGVSSALGREERRRGWG